MPSSRVLFLGAAGSCPRQPRSSCPMLAQTPFETYMRKTNCHYIMRKTCRYNSNRRDLYNKNPEKCPKGQAGGRDSRVSPDGPRRHTPDDPHGAAPADVDRDVREHLQKDPPESLTRQDFESSEAINESAEEGSRRQKLLKAFRRNTKHKVSLHGPPKGTGKGGSERETQVTQTCNPFVFRLGNASWSRYNTPV